MRSSSGFNRTSSSPQKYYGSTQIPVASQYVSKLPPSVNSAISYSRNQPSYPGIIGGTQYLHPQAGLSSISSSRPIGSSVLTVPTPVSYNNFIDPRPISYHTASYSPPRIVQAPTIAVSTLANQLPPQSQVVYRQTNPIDGGFYHPNQFEQSQIQKTMNTTSIIRKFNTTSIQSNAEQLNEVYLDRIRVYKKSNVERVFGREVTIECNYEPYKLFSTKELRGFLVSGFQEFEANLQKLEQSFSGLESSFYHLLHKGDAPKDIFDRFLVTLDKRVEKFFESFDETVIQGRGLAQDYFDTSVMRNDYEFWNFKSVVKQGVIEVSNKLNDLFVSRDNSTFYDAQIIRCMETIIKLYQFLKSDLNTILNKSLLKSGKILEACTYNYEMGEGLKTINFADYIQLDIASLISQYSEEFERTYPVLLNKKQIVTEKFHDILKDKSTQNQFDLKQLVRSVFQRERRKLYRTIYNAIVKNGKNELELDEEMLAENKSITDKMNKIKNRYLTIKNDPLFLEVVSGRMNLEYLKNSPTLFEENSQSVLQLEKFMVNTQQFFEDIKEALSDIIYYKQKEQDRNKDILSNILGRAVFDLNQQEKIIQDKGDMSELILYQFQTLEKSLNSDHNRQNVDNTLESTLMKQLKNNQTNYHLHSVAADIARQEKQKDEQRKVQHENQIKKSKEYSSQIANLMTKPMIDKERTNYPVRDNYDQYEDDKYEQNSSNLKGLADKLLQTIKQKREEDLEKERRLKEEQEEVRYMKEQQYREERERLNQEKQRRIESSNQKFNQRRELEQQEFQSRLLQRQNVEQDRKERDLERQREEEYKKQRADEDKKRQREEQDQLRKAREEDDKQKRLQDEQIKRQRDDDLKRQREEDDKSRQQEKEDYLKKQKDDEDRRKREDEDKRKLREQDDLKRKQKEDEDRKKQQQAEEERRKRAEDEEKKRLEDQKKRDEQKRIQQEEDDRKKKLQQEEDKRKQEELKRQREEEDRKRKQDEEDRKRKREEEDRKREEERKKQEDERKRLKDEEDRKRKQDEEDRKKKLQQEEEDRKKKHQQEEEDRKRRLKEEEDHKKKEEEDRKKREEEDRKKKEEERKKKEEEDRKKKEEEDRKKKQKEEEEERKRKQEEAEAAKLKEELNKKNQKSSGFNYDDLGGSEESGSQYKEDFDIDDYDEILGKDESKNKKTNEPAKTNKGFDQDELYEDIAEDSDNFNDLVGKFNKPTTTGAAATTNTKKPEPTQIKVRNDKYDDFEDLDDNFDDFNDDDLDNEDNNNNIKKPEPPKVQKTGLPSLSNNAKQGDESKRSNIQNSYEDDFEDFDDFSDNKKKNQQIPQKVVEQKKSDKKSDFDDFEDIEIEEDIEDLMGDTSKNDKSANIIKPATTAVTSKPATLQPIQDKNKKQSNFDYDMDFDDNEDLNDDLEKDFKEEVQKQPQKNDASKKPKQDEYDYDFPEDEDFEQGEQPEGQMTREQMEEMMEAEQQREQQNMQITYDLIQKTNDYIKKTRFGRSNRANLSNYNSYDYVIRLYEEYIQNYQVFLFDFPESMKLLELYEAFINQSSDIEQIVDEYAAEIQKIYYENTQLTDFYPQTKLYFPLEANSIGFQLIEVNMINQTISYFYMIDESEETIVQQLNDFHKFLTYTLRFDEFAASPAKVEDNTLKVLQIYEQETYLQYMIMLFPLVYEFMSDMSEIVVDQNTIDRIFYIQLSLEHFYKDLESNQDQVTEKFNSIIESYSTHKDFIISIQEPYELSNEGFEQILNDMNQFKEEVLQSDKKYGLVVFSINTGQVPFCYYFYVAKSSDDKVPHEIGLFCLTMSDQINNTMVDSFEQLEEEGTVAFRPYVDVSRHNGLYEYSEFTLATWAHLIDKKGLTPFVALNIINFSMTPFYITYKGLD